MYFLGADADAAGIGFLVHFLLLLGVILIDYIEWDNGTITMFFGIVVFDD